MSPMILIALSTAVLATYEAAGSELVEPSRHVFHGPRPFTDNDTNEKFWDDYLHHVLKVQRGIDDGFSSRAGNHSKDGKPTIKNKDKPTKKLTKHPNVQRTTSSEPVLPHCRLNNGADLRREEYDALYYASTTLLSTQNYDLKRMIPWTACISLTLAQQERWVFMFMDSVIANMVNVHDHTCVVEFSHDKKSNKLKLLSGPACQVDQADICPSQLTLVGRCPYKYTPMHRGDPGQDPNE